MSCSHCKRRDVAVKKFTVGALIFALCIVCASQIGDYFRGQSNDKVWDGPIHIALSTTTGTAVAWEMYGSFDEMLKQQPSPSPNDISRFSQTDIGQ